MAKVLRVGDTNSAGGAILNGVSSVRVNGKPVATVGSKIAPHSNFKGPHTHAQINPGGTSSVKVGGQVIATTSNKDSCGHGHSTGSPNVNIGG